MIVLIEGWIIKIDFIYLGFTEVSLYTKGVMERDLYITPASRRLGSNIKVVSIVGYRAHQTSAPALRLKDEDATFSSFNADGYDKHRDHGHLQIQESTMIHDNNISWAVNYIWGSDELYLDKLVDAEVSHTWPKYDHIRVTPKLPEETMRRHVAPFTYTLLFVMLYHVVGAVMLTEDDDMWKGPVYARDIVPSHRFNGEDASRDLIRAKFPNELATRGYARLTSTRKAKLIKVLTETNPASMIARGRVEVVLAVALLNKATSVYCSGAPRQLVASLEAIGAICLRGEGDGVHVPNMVE